MRVLICYVKFAQKYADGNKASEYNIGVKQWGGVGPDITSCVYSVYTDITSCVYSAYPAVINILMVFHI